MKFFVIALSLIAVCSAFAVDGRHRSSPSRVCAEELGLMPEEFEKYENELDKLNLADLVDDPKAQNLIKCYLQKVAIIDQNGDFQESVAIRTLARGAITEENVKQCIATSGDNKANAFAIKLSICCYDALVANNKNIN